MHPKHPNVLALVRRCLDEGRFLDTRHATQRQHERSITRLEVLHALRHGFHEKRKDTWDELHQAWNYAIRAKTFEQRNLRVVVSFDDETGMLIITAIDLDR